MIWSPDHGPRVNVEEFAPWSWGIGSVACASREALLLMACHRKRNGSSVTNRYQWQTAQNTGDRHYPHPRLRRWQVKQEYRDRPIHINTYQYRYNTQKYSDMAIHVNTNQSWFSYLAIFQTCYYNTYQYQQMHTNTSPIHIYTCWYISIQNTFRVFVCHYDSYMMGSLPGCPPSFLATHWGKTNNPNARTPSPSRRVGLRVGVQVGVQVGLPAEAVRTPSRSLRTWKCKPASDHGWLGP